MTSKQTAANRNSWQEVVADVEGLRGLYGDHWTNFGVHFISYGISKNFDRHFRAGTSILDLNSPVGPCSPTLVFSTLDHHGLNLEARITVSLTKTGTVRLTYWPSVPASQKDEKLDYTLDLDAAMPTFQRFLNHLWEMTKSAPIPADLRSPETPFSAPILQPSSR